MNWNPLKNKWVVAIIEVIAIIATGVAAVFTVSLVNPKPIVIGPRGTTPQATTTTDYELKETMKRVELPAFEGYMNTANGNAVSNEAIQHLQISGTLADGYVDVVADVGGKPLETDNPTKFDDVYLALIQLNLVNNNLPFGGHLIESQSLQTPTSATSTEMLFKLSAVPYLPTYTDSTAVTEVGNWLELLDDTRYAKEIIGFSSTVKPGGRIDKVTLYYTCVQGSNCSIAAD